MNSDSLKRVDQPVVSVIVITYNSSRYVLDTLESIKNQTYKNIELIISDDCSSDHTVSLIEKWVHKNSSRFTSVAIVKSSNNSGIAFNCNRGLLASKGDWVKLIAGDDILFENAIEKLLDYTSQTKDCNVLFGRIKYLKDDVLIDDEIPEIFRLNQKKQTIRNLKGSSIKAPSSFLRRQTLIDIGGFDENYPMIEDVPMWIKLSFSGNTFHFVDIFIAKYRIHNNNISISTNRNGAFIDIRFYKEQENMLRNLIIPGLYRENQFFSLMAKLNYIFVTRIILLMGNKNNILSKLTSFLVIENSITKVKRFPKFLNRFINKQMPKLL